MSRDSLTETFGRKFYISKACLQYRKRTNVLIFLSSVLFCLGLSHSTIYGKFYFSKGKEMEQSSKGTRHLGKNPSTWMSKIYSLVWNRHSLPVSLTFIDWSIKKSNCLYVSRTKPKVYQKAPFFLEIKKVKDIFRRLIP